MPDPGSDSAFVVTAPVESIAQELRPMTADDLRAHYSPADMVSASVYKFAPGQEDFDWNGIPRCVESFREFYLDVAVRRECVIVCLD
jgi:hypothetical protein